MLIAVEGCCHGELDKIYETLAYIESTHGRKVDLLLCCGDFQAVRNINDLSCLAAPEKHLRMQDFFKYYSGEKTAPIPTIFIGGNHEASNHLQELAYGGWVANNIYYLGNAGVIRFGGLRIAGLSGIYNGHNYRKGHFEVPPYTESTKRSVYHVRQLELFRLKQISRPLDIFMSHDWPVGVTDYGNKEMLLRFKPYFQEDIENGQLGNPTTWDLLKKLQPRYWFSGHLHAKFAASIPHVGAGSTNFLALDKCVPGKRFLQILEVPHDPAAPLTLSYDPEWLGILQQTNHLWSFDSLPQYMPGPGGAEPFDFTQSDARMEEVKGVFGGGSLTVDPGAFQRTAPVHEAELGNGAYTRVLDEMIKRRFPLPPRKNYVNPQTTELCARLGLTDPLVALIAKNPHATPPVIRETAPAADLNVGQTEMLKMAVSDGGGNPEEIDLDEGSALVDDGAGTLYVVEDYIPGVAAWDSAGVDASTRSSEPDAKKLKLVE